MLKMIITACMIANPQLCEDHSLGVSMSTPQHCFLMAMPLAAEWANQHPKWRVSRITCRGPGEKA